MYDWWRSSPLRENATVSVRRASSAGCLMGSLLPKSKPFRLRSGCHATDEYSACVFNDLAEGAGSLVSCFEERRVLFGRQWAVGGGQSSHLVAKSQVSKKAFPTSRDCLPA